MHGQHIRSDRSVLIAVYRVQCGAGGALAAVQHKEEGSSCRRWVARAWLPLAGGAACGVPVWEVCALAPGTPRLVSLYIFKVVDCPGHMT